MKESDSAFFITLTYTDEHQPVVQIGDDENTKWGTLKKKDFQNFMKALRYYDEQIKLKNGISQGKPIKYYAVGEYGERTFRPHYHAIILNVEPATINVLSEIWKLGHVSVGTCETASIHYVTKYVIQPRNEEVWSPLLPPFSLISKGVGRAYLNANGHYHKETLKNIVVGTLGKQRLPRYYADKIFSIRDREIIQRACEQQSDALYWKAIAELERRNPEAARALEKAIRDQHDRITKSIKDNQLNNQTI